MDFQQLRALGGEALILRPRYPSMGLKGKEGGGLTDLGYQQERTLTSVSAVPRCEGSVNQQVWKQNRLEGSVNQQMCQQNRLEGSVSQQVWQQNTLEGSVSQQVWQKNTLDASANQQDSVEAEHA